MRNTVKMIVYVSIGGEGLTIHWASRDPREIDWAV